MLKDGLLQQVDTPRNLYDRPDNLFVAGFIGSPAMNLVEAPVSADGAVVGGRTVPLPRSAASAAQGSTVTVGFRPEATSLTTAEDGIPFEVTVVEELGSDAFAYGSFTGAQAEGRDTLITVRVPARQVPMKGETVHLRIDPEELHVFDTATGKRLSA